jgi:hypothetical protein
VLTMLCCLTCTQRWEDGVMFRKDLGCSSVEPEPQEHVYEFLAQ